MGKPEDVNAYGFTVQTNQNSVAENGNLGGYEASDFLWGKVDGVKPTGSNIQLVMDHKMATARVTLMEGEGFSTGEWNDVQKQVLVTNTTVYAVIDLSTGEVAPSNNGEVKTITPSVRNNEWRAIVVPQTVKAGSTLFSLTIDGFPYKFSKDEDFYYTPGKMSNFTIRVDKKGNTGEFQLTLVGESITAWESDLVSHDGSAKEYLVINVDQPGNLAKCIEESGHDLSSVRNLKVVGKINTDDFVTMNQNMTNLSSLNLKEVKIVGPVSWSNNSYEVKDDGDWIPSDAFYRNKTLQYVILPDNLEGIGYSAFGSCSRLTGSLIIPERVESIGEFAFIGCGFNGILSLPSSLKTIGRGAFDSCQFNCELRLPDSVTEIGSSTFAHCTGLYGELHLPVNLKSLGENWSGGGAFAGCKNLRGSLEFPQGLTEIPDNSFQGCGFDGNLYLHNGIKSIGHSAFDGCDFKGDLILPSSLEILETSAFYQTKFTGELKIPASLKTIGDHSFEGCLFSGALEIGENVELIGEYAFEGCGLIEKVVIPKRLEKILTNAFQGCSGINSIVCEAENPPVLENGVFSGVAKDNFVLEVPESAIGKYQDAYGWNEFKRIAAHRELVCRPAVANALSTEREQTLIIDAESEWEVKSKPDWCVLSQNSGNKKTELTLTIKSGIANGATREGDIVFLLRGKDYTTTCHVTQYGYEYAEDEYLTLQKATRGNNGGINIVILGDGYDAKDIASGLYLSDMKQQIEYFFGIEPYTTYRDYFNVHTAFPLSTESGVGTLNTIRYNRFNTTFIGESGQVSLQCDKDEVLAYALKAPGVNESNIDQTLIILVPNTTEYGGVTHMWTSGAAIAICPKSANPYPDDARGLIQHEAGGHGFGKLADEYIYHNAFIDRCGCPCCGHVDAVLEAKSLGWYDNIEITGKMNKVGWSHLIFDPRYSGIVDIFEGGFMHSRGVYRSEQNSCMNNNIPYFSTISRESIVKRIKRYAGEAYSFEEFAANDKLNAGAITRSISNYNGNSRITSHPPVIHKGSPIKKNK